MGAKGLTREIIVAEAVADLSKVIGFGLNLALQPHLSLEDVELLLS